MARIDPTSAEPVAEPSTRPWLWWGLAALALVAGYADLVRGGESVAPVLLVIGYCVLVPIAILKS